MFTKRVWSLYGVAGGGRLRSTQQVSKANAALETGKRLTSRDGETHTTPISGKGPAKRSSIWHLRFGHIYVGVHIHRRYAVSVD